MLRNPLTRTKPAPIEQAKPEDSCPKCGNQMARTFSNKIPALACVSCRICLPYTEVRDDNN